MPTQDNQKREKKKPHNHLAVGHYPSRSAKDRMLTKREIKDGLDRRIVITWLLLAFSLSFFTFAV